VSESSLEGALALLADLRTDDASMADPFARLLPVTGSAVSTVGELLGSETLAASDALAADIDELQFDLGEGPSWEASRVSRPVLTGDLRGALTTWPVFAPAAVSRGVRAIFAFPLSIGPLRFGAVDLYSTTSLELDGTDLDVATLLAGTVARRVLHRALADLASPDETGSSPFSRRVVQQATGMVLAQLDISAEDAKLVMQGHAFANGQTMMEVAERLVERRLRFTRTGTGIEERS
jgi:hypothetical protein